MLKLLGSVLYALIWDANAARRWLRGVGGVLAVSGALYAEQIGALTGSARLASFVKGAALLSAFAFAAHDAQRKKKLAALPEPKP